MIEVFNNEGTEIVTIMQGDNNISFTWREGYALAHRIEELSRRVAVKQVNSKKKGEG